jgi:hypothetical protein
MCWGVLLKHMTVWQQVQPTAATTVSKVQDAAIMCLFVDVCNEGNSQ